MSKEIIQLADPVSANLWCSQKRKNGSSIGFVPTMGALHEGHLSLVRRSVRENQVTCVSIFVNPLQFNDKADLESYPDTYVEDVVMLKESGCDMVYKGTLRQFFPEYVDVSKIQPECHSAAIEGLEGFFRPGHLEGVWAIVDRLFKTVGDCRAYFGEKDYQQTLVVRDLAYYLAKQALSIDVVVCPTVREKNGLAMSSRNRHLSEQAHKTAGQIYQGMQLAIELWRQGIRQGAQIENVVRNYLLKTGFDLEYVAVRDQLNWTENTPEYALHRARILVAAYLGDIRLIDNLVLEQ